MTITRLKQRLAWHEKSESTPLRSINPQPNIAERLYAERRRREKFFKAALFGEPAWDLLLDLYINQERGKAISVTSACIGAVVPPTTALRWINMLEQSGFVARSPDPDDGRRSHLLLQAEATETMRAYLSGI